MTVCRLWLWLSRSIEVAVICSGTEPSGAGFERIGFEKQSDDYTLSSLVFVNGQIFIRTDTPLWAIGQPHKLLTRAAA